MAKKKRKGPSGPRRWRMKREGRLAHARARWGELDPPLPTLTFIRRYRNWFRIDALCAALEVQQLGRSVPANYLEQLRRQQKRRSQPKKTPAPAEQLTFEIWELYALEYLDDETESLVELDAASAQAFAERAPYPWLDFVEDDLWEIPF